MNHHSEFDLSEEEWDLIEKILDKGQIWIRNKKRGIKEENHLKITNMIAEVTGSLMIKELVKTSKFLSRILRHQPQEIGLTLDKNGWADVNELVEKSQIALDTIEKVVTTSNKQRFTFNDDKTKIRASQGHSIKVDLELKPVEPPETLYHGTIKERLDSIEKDGLIKGKRQYVHLSKDRETACKVGRRHKGVLLILIIDARKMHENGYEFFLSKNGVWLTDKVPTDYLTESRKLNNDWMK